MRKEGRKYAKRGSKKKHGPEPVQPILSCLIHSIPPPARPDAPSDTPLPRTGSNQDLLLSKSFRLANQSNPVSNSTHKDTEKTKRTR
jgi:hypothetical protein